MADDIEAIAKDIAQRAREWLERAMASDGTTTYAALPVVDLERHTAFERVIAGPNQRALRAAIVEALKPVAKDHKYECVVVWSGDGRDRFDYER